MTRTARTTALVVLLVGSAGPPLAGADQIAAREPGAPPPASGQGAAERIDFARDVVPVLTKAGCNAGACHGSFQGRGGFRLSLLGFDPPADYEKLVKEVRGRRVFPAAPEQSLVLLKPTLAMPHGGGRRLAEDSESYRILRAWIAQGLPAPRPDDARVARLEVTPGEATLAVGEAADLRVLAQGSDGWVRDATRWALYESREPAVAEVSPLGRVVSAGPGRTAITVRYLGQVAAVPVTTPYARLDDNPDPGRQNFIDDFIVAGWRKLGLAPAPLADDAEFLRRVSADLIGTLPTADEARRFLASTEADKRARLIDELLQRPEYVDYWALKWSDLLRAHRRSLGEKGLWSFTGWLRQALRDNVPVDRIVRDLLTAQGNLYTNGAVAFYFVDKTPEELAETTAQLFLGVRLQCARCHHHPFEVWEQDDYYGLAAFFARIERKDTREGGAFGGAQSVRAAAEGNLMHPATGQPVSYRLLGRPLPEAEAREDPRQALAEWITGADNPYFARGVVNRYWGYLFGRGLIEPVDDVRATNPPTHPALLDALERDFVEHGYDLKHLLRTLSNSRVYQLASEVVPERDADGTFYTHRVPRRLSAEVLLDAINQASGTSEAFENLPPGMRAISLPDSTVASYFLDTFGRPRRTSTCECERVSRPDLKQALHLANGEAIHQKVTAAEGRVADLVGTAKSDQEIVEELYLSTLARRPAAEEQATALRFVSEAPSRKEGFEDLLWTLLNCTQFVFNH